MKKIMFVMPLMAMSLVVSCSNNANTDYWPSCYDHMTYYNKGQKMQIADFQYYKNNLLKKSVGYSYAKKDLKTINERHIDTYEYNDYELVTKHNYVSEQYTEKVGPIELLEEVQETYRYDDRLNLVELEAIDTRYKSGSAETKVLLTTYDYEYDDHDNITFELMTEKLNGELREQTKYEATYDDLSRLLTRTDYDYNFDEEKLVKITSEALTYEGSNKYYKTREVDEYKKDLSYKYTNEFDQIGRPIKCIVNGYDINATDDYVEGTYYYDLAGNLSSEIWLSFSESRGELVYEASYKYFNNDPEKLEEEISTGYSKYAPKPNLNIQRYGYDKHGRVLYDEYIYGRTITKPEVHDLYVYEYKN